MSFDDRSPIDPRDTLRAVTDAEVGELLADSIEIIILYDTRLVFPHGIASPQDALHWLSTGKQLSLAAGSGQGELSFANKLMVAPNNITLLDKNAPMNLSSFAQQGVTYTEKTLQQWSAHLVSQELKSTYPIEVSAQYRLITLFGAEYVFDVDKMVPAELAVFARAIALALEPCGILYISPRIPVLDAVLAAAGLNRVDLKFVQIYQKLP